MLFFSMRSPLFVRAGDASGAGAGTGDGSNNSGAFDPVAFKAEILGELNKTLNGFGKTMKTDIQKMLEPKTTAGNGEGAGTGTGEGSGEGEGSGDGQRQQQQQRQQSQSSNLPPDVNARFQALERRLNASSDEIKKLTTERDAAKAASLETERISTVRDVLAGIEFRDPAARSAAMKMFLPDVKRDQDGNLIAEGDKGPLPVKDYITSQVDSMPWLLAASGKSGSGASNTGRVAGTKAAQIENIRPGMSAEETAAATAAIAAALTPQ